MTVYAPPSVSDQPMVRLRHWRVYETETGERHLVGIIPNYYHSGRVSSAIQKYEDGVFTTSSGRKYVLCGPSSTHYNADYIWEIWSSYHGVKHAVNRSMDYIGDCHENP